MVTGATGVTRALTPLTPALTPLTRLTPLLCLIATAPVARAVLTQTNDTAPPEASRQTDAPPPAAPAPLTGSDHFRAEAAGLVSHVTVLLRYIQPQRYPEGEFGVWCLVLCC